MQERKKFFFRWIRIALLNWNASRDGKRWKSILFLNLNVQPHKWLEWKTHIFHRSVCVTFLFWFQLSLFYFSFHLLFLFVVRLVLLLWCFYSIHFFLLKFHFSSMATTATKAITVTSKCRLATHCLVSFK